MKKIIFLDIYLMYKIESIIFGLNPKFRCIC